MNLHSKRSPSDSPRWMVCHGSIVYSKADGGASIYADEGSAAHGLCARCLESGKDASEFIGETLSVNGNKFLVDEDFAANCQMYIDDVRERAAGGYVLVEQRVDLSPWLGYEPCEVCKGTGKLKAGVLTAKCKPCKGTGIVRQGGTSDAVIYHEASRTLIVEDLKFGRGEQVWASFERVGLSGTKRHINQQLGHYALGSLALVELLGPVEKVLVVINQPRINHVDEFEISISDLMEFGEEAKYAVSEGDQAIKVFELHGEDSADFQMYLTPEEKACRWCPKSGACKKQAAKIQDDTRSDFETIAEQPPLAPSTNDALSRAWVAMPFIQAWVSAVSAEVHRRVAAGVQLLGVDGLPLKFVGGKQGDRKWTDEALATEALLGQLGEGAYQPRKILTASAAAKKLDKKKTQELWNDVFLPLIKRASGRPTLVNGSDPRQPYDNSATADEFEEIGVEE